MSDIVIKTENLGKKFRLRSGRVSDLRTTFGNFINKIIHGKNRGNHFSNNTDSGKQKISSEFWALKDISFDIKRGEAVGIIGRNGAGKSTLLKILSRIMAPTTGRFMIDGRISSLLEVGTGFHLELTGRENVFLNGTILGMKRQEIRKKFDEIVEFSGVEKFINTPVKHYSSGMQVRLAFSVAAHLEAEILLIDEVLAVGDAEFQKKCLGKMEDVTGQGRTVLFVSHNLPSVRSFCSKGVFLNASKIIKSGTIEEVIDTYLARNFTQHDITGNIHYFQNLIKIESVTINGEDNIDVKIQNGQLNIVLNIELLTNIPFELDVHIKRFDTLIASYANFVKGKIQTLSRGQYELSYTLDVSSLKSGK